MNNFNFQQTRADVLLFLGYQFRNAPLKRTDIEDCFSKAIETMLLDARKPQPRLRFTAQTAKRLAYFAAIDTYRKMKNHREIAFDGCFNLSDDETPLKRKELIETVIKTIQQLPDRQKALLEQKYDARYFDDSATLDEMQQFKSRQKTKIVHQDFGFTTDGALRQAQCQTLKIVRSCLRA